jgi:hypothetical protein
VLVGGGLDNLIPFFIMTTTFWDVTSCSPVTSMLMWLKLRYPDDGGGTFLQSHSIGTGDDFPVGKSGRGMKLTS